MCEWAGYRSAAVCLLHQVQLKIKSKGGRGVLARHNECEQKGDTRDEVGNDMWRGTLCCIAKWRPIPETFDD